MLSNYPPGVTGNEPEIAGYPDDHCADCGAHLSEPHDPYCAEDDTYAPLAWDDDLPEHTCRFCDSPYHQSYDEGECRSHFA